MNNRNWRGIAAWVFFVILILFIWQSMRSVGTEHDISYSEFKKRLHSGQIEGVTVRQDLIRGESRGTDGKEEFFHTTPLNDPTLVDDLERNHVKDYAGEVDRSWFSVIAVNAIPTLVFLFLWFLMIRQMQGGGKQAMPFAGGKRSW